MAKKKAIQKKAEQMVRKKTDSMCIKMSEKNGKQALVLAVSENAAKNATGLKTEGSLKILRTTLITALTDNNSYEARENIGNEILAMLTELNPKDGFEGMLISQMVNVYEQAMESFRLANVNHPNSFDIYQQLQNQGIKLMRLYNQQLDTLDKHRNKGKQKMTIEHVHIHSGAQAVVGNVSQGVGRVKD